ncbi:MAG: glutamyl-tRNA reductase [Puniceicoccaceae bacterium MED-G31]|nr:MAG: glutamyl-tRNA reductase [Puniceicoccaceae bacterium MED-G31]
MTLLKSHLKMSENSLQSLFVIGCSHHRTPLEVREHIALSKEEVEGFLLEIKAVQGIHECLVLATCNRLEVYGIAESREIQGEVCNIFCQHRNIEAAIFYQHSYQITNLEVIEHAFEVATGLDSQMIGETEILGQMKEAYAFAKNSNCTGKIINRLFEKCFQAAKAARTQTNITKGQVSIGNIAVSLAERIFGALESSRVLLLGSGEVGALTTQALKSRGVTDITVSSRTFQNAKKLANEFNGNVIDFADFYTQLELFDIIICSTAAPSCILSPTIIEASLKSRPERPLFLIDLAMPRDIDPEIDTIENVYLYNLDDLSEIANQNIINRKIDIDKAKGILKTQAWVLWLQLRQRTIGNPTIAT